jgi:hypothetical protein
MIGHGIIFEKIPHMSIVTHTTGSGSNVSFAAD